VETIQVVLDTELLRAAEHAARRSKVNRSALIREALRAHLKRLHMEELEARDRKGYQTEQKEVGELSGWESEAVWPAE
jgi:metal-responsive CopG/Arc/MetJ family transcriptional regulator